MRTALARPRAENPFSSLGVSSLRRFGEDLYDMVDVLPFAWCGVAIHKAFARECLKVRDGRTLFSLAYRTTVEQLHGWCVEGGRVGRFFIDQRERNLEGRVHREIGKLHEGFSDWTGHAQRVCRIQDSRRSHHLQLADIIAYNVLRRFRESDRTYPYFLRVLPKLWAPGGLVVYGPEELQK